jgi:D-alanine-D-alanine ligase
MNISILHNCDHELLADDPGREAREDVVKVAAALSEALTRDGIFAEPVPVRGLVDTVTTLERRKPDLVINLCESLAADARGEMVLPAVLDMLGIPYSGSSALALGLALHKNKAKELLFARGVSTPEFAVVDALDELAGLDLPYPLIVKPAREDASVGIDFSSVVADPEALARAVAHVLNTFAQPALVERYIEGREIYVPLLGNSPREALPLTEIRFGKAFEGKPRIVSYRAKWDAQSPECIDSPSGPCLLDAHAQERCVTTALAAFEALDCRDYGRVDLRLAADGKPYVIDVNPNCDLHPQAGYAKAAAAAGISYPELALHLVEVALERSHGNSLTHHAGPRAAGDALGTDRELHSLRAGVRARAHRHRAQGD